jgi:aryl-alcohol dehydrogenase-like predicted oxidoreductase
MLNRPFGKLGWHVSAVGLGTWNIGNQWGAVDDATAWGTVRAAFDSGVNLFDVAESYGIPNGLSEERLGVALAGIRHRVYVVSKIGSWGRRTGQIVPKTTTDMIRLCAHASLHRLRSDWHDVLLCHEDNLADYTIYLESFELLKQEGRLRSYGISTDSLDVLKRFNVNGTCSVVEVDYSLVNRVAEAELFPYCEEHGIAVIIRGPLRQGLLAGKYTLDSVFTDPVRAGWNQGGAQRASFEADMAKVEKLKQHIAPGSEMVNTALRFSFSHPVAPVTIPGAKSPEQAIMNAQPGDRVLTAKELTAINAIF